MIEQDKIRLDRHRRHVGNELSIREGRRIAISGVMVLLLLAIGMLAAPTVSSARVAVGISVSFAPPALPVYIQPPCPGPDYIWTPGYWAWDPAIGYYWVPGTWVLAPFTGALWTPGYWGWSNGLFVWFPGYWGLTVGFYGGINYGFGYTGYGYEGGYWDHGSFYYNRSVNNINVTNVTNYYNATVSRPISSSYVSYNGGRGGTTVRPTAAQLAVARERHTPPTDLQLHNERTARVDPGQRAKVNHGRPAVAATSKPGVLSGSGVVRASRAGAPYKAAPSGKADEHNVHARPSHPAGGAERSPHVSSAPQHAAPPAHVERHAAPRNEPAREPSVHARPSHPAGGAERSPHVSSAPQRAAPPAHVERHAAPRNEPAREPSVHARPSHPAGGAEKSPHVSSAPQHAAPPAHVERHAAPRNEPARQAQRGSQHEGKPKCC